MIKEIEKAKVGYDKVVEVFDDLIANIEKAKADEIAEVELKYAERLEKYTNDRSNYVETDYVELPDEEEQISENTEEYAESAQMGNTINEFQSV